MKKITLSFFLLLLFLFKAQAQVFPAPYCEIADAAGVTVEPILSVDFASSSIANTDVTSVLVNQTSTLVNIAPDETYSLVVTGDTKGNFNTNIVAFIDWNQNDILDDAGEVYAVGTLTNTDGTDGVFVSLDITVPTDAVLGETRIRLTKTYTDSDSVAEVDACGIKFNVFGFSIESGFGQALDFTLNIAPLSVGTFEVNALSVYPNPAQDILNINYKSPLNNVKIYNLLGQEVLQQNATVSQLQLDISTLTTGIYIVKLFTEEGQHSLKIIKE